MAILFALLAAAGWGSSDFAAGYASRKVSAVSVVVLTHLAATLALIAISFAPGQDGSPTGADLLWGLAAGVGGGFGAMLLFRGLGKGSMSVVAPITATGAATIPVLAGLLQGESIGLLGLLGIGVALVAIVMVSLGDEAADDESTDAPERSGEPVSTDPSGPEPSDVTAVPSAALAGRAASPSAPIEFPPRRPVRAPGLSALSAPLARTDVRYRSTPLPPPPPPLPASVSWDDVSRISAETVAELPPPPPGAVPQSLDGTVAAGVATLAPPVDVSIGAARPVGGQAVPSTDLADLPPLVTVDEVAVHAPADVPPPQGESDDRPAPERGLGSILHRPGVVEALLSGIGFGLFFVFIARTSEAAGHWPLVSARFISVVIFSAVAIMAMTAVVPDRASRPPVVVAGLLDAAAAVCFVLATRSGLLSVGAVLASLYPAVTVLLARVIAQERIARQQLVGLALAGAAITLLVL